MPQQIIRVARRESINIIANWLYSLALEWDDCSKGSNVNNLFIKVQKKQMD